MFNPAIYYISSQSNGIVLLTGIALWIDSSLVAFMPHVPNFNGQRFKVEADQIMSISTRVSISWPPTIAPEESTDTLVLNFPSGHFIDLRPLKCGYGLDWGMAGHQIVTGTTDGSKSTYSQVARD